MFSRYCCPKVGRYCDPPSGAQGAKGLKFQWKAKKNIDNLLKLLEKWLTYKLRRFWMVFNFFWFCLTLSVTKKLKNSIFEMPIITQTLNINNLRTTGTKSINLHTLRKLVEYSLKKNGSGSRGLKRLIIQIKIMISHQKQPLDAFLEISQNSQGNTCRPQAFIEHHWAAARSIHPEMFLGKGVLKICCKFTLRYGCSPVNLLHIFRKPFLKNTSGWLLLDCFCSHISNNQLPMPYALVKDTKCEIKWQ